MKLVHDCAQRLFVVISKRFIEIVIEFKNLQNNHFNANNVYFLNELCLLKVVWDISRYEFGFKVHIN